MKKNHLVLIFIFSVILIFLLGVLLVTRNVQHTEQKTMLNLSINKNLGGDFILPSTLGKPLDSMNLRGQITLITFGYANCAEICPIGLMQLHEVIKGLNEKANNLNVIFVSFDSSKDLNNLSNYLHKFDPSIIGVAGSEDEIAYLTKRFGVVYPKERNLEGGASFEHNGFIYLLDQQGHIRAIYQNRTPVKRIISDIQSLQRVSCCDK